MSGWNLILVWRDRVGGQLGPIRFSRPMNKAQTERKHRQLIRRALKAYGGEVRMGGNYVVGGSCTVGQWPDGDYLAIKQSPGPYRWERNKPPSTATPGEIIAQWDRLLLQVAAVPCAGCGIRQYPGEQLHPYACPVRNPPPPKRNRRK